MPVTALYAGLLGLLFFVLTYRVVQVRRSRRVEIGDGGDKQLLRRIRVQANFVEQAPFILLLMALAESTRPPLPLLHAVGLLLLVGRIIHAYGLSHEPHILPMRAWGMYLTVTALMGAIAMCLASGVQLLVGPLGLPFHLG
jgi:uncharacterized membrane protein YecN with MAPEG domain